MSDKVKRKLERLSFHGGLENTLGVIAWTVLVLGALGFLVLWVVGADAGSGWAGFLGGAGQLVRALVVWAVLKALAELIRLQKKAIGLNYGGKISSAEVDHIYSCAECGEVLQKSDWCYRCNKAVEPGDDEESAGPRDA